MTPKEKAKDILSKFNNELDKEMKRYIVYQTPEESIRCSLILVNEILNLLIGSTLVIAYWQEVKKEIELM